MTTTPAATTPAADLDRLGILPLDPSREDVENALVDEYTPTLATEYGKAVAEEWERRSLVNIRAWLDNLNKEPATPAWRTDTGEQVDEMLDDLAVQAAHLIEAITWHHHSQRHKIESPTRSRQRALDLLEAFHQLIARDRNHQ
jgi:hypothetical protein